MSSLVSDGYSMYSGTRGTPRSVTSGFSERGDVSDLESLSSMATNDYSGPKLFKQLESKSNKNLIKNAVMHSCLPGKVNESVRNKTLKALDQIKSGHLMILFRDSKLQYRAIYDFDIEMEKLQKVTGNGPNVITTGMVQDLYKYNSGKRNFSLIPSKTLSMSIDAVTIKNNLWQKK